MKKQAFNSLLLTLIILIFSLVSKVDRDNLRKISSQNNIQDTSLTASIQPALLTPQKESRTTVIDLPDFAGLIVPQRKEGVPLPATNVQAALVEDLDTGTDLFDLKSDARWPIASVTKLMTIVIALENVGRDKHIPISEKAFNTEGESGKFKIGEIYKTGDLIKASLVVSSNDAAQAIADFYGESNFISAMAEKAGALGMSQTNFSEVTGLSFLNQSTARDLEKLVKYILKTHPDIFDTTRLKEVVITDVNNNNGKTLTNINVFAGRPDFLGGKTGFIDAAGKNQISIFQHQGHRILIIVFGAEIRFEQTELLYNWMKSAYTF
ncbi:MAG: serine hydrolase [bacterium]|nr:serine hydrolase [bacterium]